MDMFIMSMGESTDGSRVTTDIKDEKRSSSSPTAILFLAVNILFLSVITEYDTSINFYCDNVISYMTQNCYSTVSVSDPITTEEEIVVCEDGRPVYNSMDPEIEYEKYSDGLTCSNCSYMQVNSRTTINKYEVQYNNSYECSRNICLLTTCGINPVLLPIVNAYEYGDISVYEEGGNASCYLYSQSTVDETSEIIFSKANYDRDDVSEGRFQRVKSAAAILLTISIMIISAISRRNCLVTDDRDDRTRVPELMMSAAVTIPVGLLGYFLSSKYMSEKTGIQLLFLAIMQAMIWVFIVEQMSDTHIIGKLFEDLVMRHETVGYHCGKMVRGRVEVEELLRDRIIVMKEIRKELKIELIVMSLCLAVNTTILTIEMYRTATGDYLRFSLVTLFIDSFIVTVMIMFKIATFNNNVERMSQECGFKTGLEILILSAQISMSLIVSISVTFVNNVMLKVDENSKICSHTG